MSVITHRHLYCDGKGCSDAAFVPCIGTDSDPIPAQRKSAREQYGWVRVRWRGRMLDLCELCKVNHPSRLAPAAKG